MRAALVVAVAACSGRAPIASCDDDLSGSYVSTGSDGERWSVIDLRATLEAYPLFADATATAFPPPPREVVIAPRVLDLHRGAGGAIDGELHRRYMLHAASCVARAPAHVVACAGGQLELVLGDPPTPLAFAPCRYLPPPGSRVVRWRRE